MKIFVRRVLILLIRIELVWAKINGLEDEDVTFESHNGHVYSNTWAVHLEGGHRFAREIIERHGFHFHGQVGSLIDIYHIEHKEVSKRSKRCAEHHKELSNHPNVRWIKQQKILKRKKRGYFSDPLFEDQWYLKNEGKYYISPFSFSMNHLYT